MKTNPVQKNSVQLESGLKYKKDTLFNNLTWMTSREAAEYLRISQNNLRVMIYRGKLIPYKFNNRNRFKREELDRLIESSIKKEKSYGR